MNGTAERAFKDALGEMKHHRKDMYLFTENPTAELQRVEQNATLFAEEMKQRFGIDLDKPMLAHAVHSTMAWLMMQVHGSDVCEHHAEHRDTMRMITVVESANAVAEAVYAKHGFSAPDWCANCKEGADVPPSENP